MTRTAQPWTPPLLPVVAAVAVAGVCYLLASAPASAPAAKSGPPNCPDGKCPAPWCPAPAPQPAPAPSPDPRPRDPRPYPPRIDPLDPFPAPRPSPWGGLLPPVGGPERGGSVVAGRAYDGEELSADLPGSEQFKNIGSRKDGAGMCVFTAIEMAARWQGIESFRGWRDWCAQNYGGGGYPGKVDQLVKAWCAHKGIEAPPYVQYEGQSPEQILDLIDRTRRMACVTYGTSPRYGGQTIAHMVCAPKCGSTGRYAAVLDNNFIGEQSYEWMDRTELLRRIKHPSGRAWVFVWLAAAPSLPPFN